MKRRRLVGRREHKFMPIELEDVRLDGYFSGYASLFNRVDQGGDEVAPGAFAKSLAKRGAEGIRMLFQHNPEEPIGHWSKIIEDAHGLYVEGVLTRGVSRGAEILELLRDGSVDGLSIGFRTVKSRTDPATGVRRILEADLWEISIVTFPMLEGARVDTVKNSGRSLPSIREFERWLTRDAGLSRRHARTVISEGYGALVHQRDAVCGKTADLTDLIRKAAKSLSHRSN